MYEDPIPHHYAASHYGCHDTHHIQNNNNSGITSPYEQLPLDPDQELQRLHQHQLLIQLRLEVNSLRTQIQQLELLKQQLVQQRDTMSPGEYDQMMDQFSRTSASLFSNAACRSLRHDGVSGGGNGRRSGSSTPPFSLAGLDRIPDYMSFGGSAAGGGIMGGGGGGGGAPMMDRLQERLRNMTLQQQEYAQREHDQLHHQLYCQQQQQQQQGQQGQGHHQPGMMSPSSSSRSRDPVKAEQTKLEAELRDLEQRMRSIQLLC
ncbi:MAG: hypothetical protein J3R72DRAFT_419574 [Linnemannia gamsii]|nr:MAG: hypothetical protein J3R72DRAFT_419574 [Linnemannia gamsii]